MTPGLRTVAGRLSAAATLRGTLDDPRVAGRLEWRDGRLAFTGYGEYQAIHLALHGDEKSVRIDELVGRAGRGNARVTGGARHVDGKGYEVDAKANVTQFPLYTEGQPLAEVTVDAAVRGTVSPRVSRLAVDLDKPASPCRTPSGRTCRRWRRPPTSSWWTVASPSTRPRPPSWRSWKPSCSDEPAAGDARRRNARESPGPSSPSTPPAASGSPVRTPSSSSASSRDFASSWGRRPASSERSTCSGPASTSSAAVSTCGAIRP